MMWPTKKEVQRRAVIAIIRMTAGASYIAVCTWALSSYRDLCLGTKIVLVGCAVYGVFRLVKELRHLVLLIVIASNIVILQVMANGGDQQAIRVLDGAPPDWIDRRIYPRYFEER